MASMGYSTSTVGSLMTLVDAHRDEIKESTYVEICNALKFLHDNKKRQEELRRLNQTTRPSVPSASPQTPLVGSFQARQRGVTQVAHRSNIQGVTRYTDDQINTLIDVYEGSMRNMRPRVTNKIKLKAMIIKFEDLNVFNRIDMNNQTNVIVKRNEERLMELGVSMAELKSYYQVVKNREAERNRNRIRRQIETLRSMLSTN